MRARICCALAIAWLPGCGGSESRSSYPLPSACGQGVSDVEGAERCAAQIYDELIAAQVGVYDDPEVQAYVERVGERIVAASGAELAVHYRVLDSPTAQAFAAPGGRVYVTRGLLAQLDSEAELAAVVGHEVGHIAAGHTTTLLERLPSVSAQVSLEELFRLSRDDEAQADQLAVRYLAAAAYDPAAVASALESLRRAEADSAMPSWMARHPPLHVRLALVGRAADGRSTGERVRGRYLAQLDGLVVGDDPRNGILRGNRYLHARAGFSIALPAGFEVTRDGDGPGLTAGREDGVFVMVTPLGPPDSQMLRWIVRVAGEDGRRDTLAGFAAVTHPPDRGSDDEPVFSSAAGPSVVTTFEARDGYVYALVVTGPSSPVELSRVHRAVVASARREAGAGVAPRRLRVLRAPADATLAELVARGTCGRRDELPLLERMNARSTPEGADRWLKCVGR